MTEKEAKASFFLFAATTFAPSGRNLAMCHVTQRGALGYEVLPLWGDEWCNNVIFIIFVGNEREPTNVELL